MNRTKEEIFEAMDAQTVEVTCTVDMFINAKKVKDYVILDTFGSIEQRDRKHTLEDVLHYYEDLQRQEEIDLSDELAHFREAIQSQEAEIRYLNQMFKTECFFHLTLRCFAEKHGARLLLYKNLESDGEQRLFDAILIHPYFTVIACWKSPIREVRISEDGIYSWYELVDGEVIESPLLLRMEEKKDILESILEDNGIFHRNTYLLVVYRSDYRFLNFCEDLMCVKMPDVVSHLELMQSLARGKKQNIDRIVDALDSAETEPSGPELRYASLLMEAYAELRSTVEESL